MLALLPRPRPAHGVVSGRNFRCLNLNCCVPPDTTVKFDSLMSCNDYCCYDDYGDGDDDDGDGDDDDERSFMMINMISDD